MREFYFEDKEKSIIFTGMQPKDDINCDPYDYFMYLGFCSLDKLTY